jgi:hypothetical protein
MHANVHCKSAIVIWLYVVLVIICLMYKCVSVYFIHRVLFSKYNYRDTTNFLCKLRETCNYLMWQMFIYCHMHMHR